MKKSIVLKERADIGGEVRRPEEGPILVAKKLADELVEQGKAKWSGPDAEADKA